MSCLLDAVGRRLLPVVRAVLLGLDEAIRIKVEPAVKRFPAT
jgi:hypothetical protein